MGFSFVRGLYRVDVDDDTLAAAVATISATASGRDTGTA
jgi:hypothetical protein